MNAFPAGSWSEPSLVQAGIVCGGVLLATALLGYPGLPLLRRLKVGQTVREDGPKTHYAKTGTPTFGGFLFLVPILVAAMLAPLLSKELSALPSLALMTAGFAFVGFLDDYIKVRIDRKGLSVRAKSLLLLAIAVLYTGYQLYFSGMPTQLVPPFAAGGPILLEGWWKAAYGVFLVVFLYIVCNSVNITDGVDGLASSVTATVGASLAVLALLLPPAVAGRAGASLFAAALAGGCLGFLVHNRHPAKVFMGDTGSQALGAGIAGVSILMGCPWILLPAGVVYAAESLSVVIQVFWYKRTRTRIFRMSPIHHHFELGGWRERRIVAVFTAVAAAGCLVAALMLLL